MKKGVIVLISLLSIMFLFGCGGSDYDDADKSKVSKGVAEDSYLYEKIHYFHDYAMKYDMVLPEFKEYVDVANTLTFSNFEANEDGYVYVNEDASFSEAKSYTATLDDYGDYSYWGELNNDMQPDGIGILFESYGDYMDPDLLVKYMGEFEDGCFSGYGVEFEIPDLYNDYPIEVTQEMFDENLMHFNKPIYEGYFEEGRRSGEGVEILSNYGGVHIETGEVLLDPSKAGFSAYIGEYKKGDIDGQCLIYEYGRLIYEGEFKNGDKNGEGIEYFSDPSGVVKYEGEFSGGLYHGKGVLYDENGDVVYKGKFASGDIK